MCPLYFIIIDLPSGKILVGLKILEMELLIKTNLVLESFSSNTSHFWEYVHIYF